MAKNSTAEWADRPDVKRILQAFSDPNIPRQVERELGIRKLKLQQFFEQGLIRILNPKARKGRYYALTGKARKMLRLPCQKDDNIVDWGLRGWVTASPKQRLVVLKAMGSQRRTSEEIRYRASRTNPHLTRISTKGILKELVEKGLAESELSMRKKYYWLTRKGNSLVDAFNWA